MPDKQTEKPMTAIPEKFLPRPELVSRINPAWADYMEAREKKWQAMCQRFVGAGMLADEFADVPHDPETFGNYVQNLNDQIASAPSPAHKNT